MFRSVTFKSFLTSLAGSTILAFGLYHIHSFSGVTEGGQLGLSLLLNYWFSISPAVTTAVVNIICYWIGWKTLGKPFIAHSIIATGGFSAVYWICQQFPPLWPQLSQMPLLAALLGSVFVGLGCGLCVRVGGAACGDDGLAMSISEKLRVKIEYVYLFFDISVLLLSLTYIPLGKILYSLLTVILSGKLVGIVQRFSFRKEATV